MALDFGTRAQTRYVNWGTLGDDELLSGTILAWIKPTDAGASQWDNIILARPLASPEDYNGLAVGDSNVSFQRMRPTDYLSIASNNNPITNNAWHFIAVVWDTAGVAGDQKLYYGNRSTPAAEVTYGTQSAGSGTPYNLTASVYTGSGVGLSWETDFAGAIAVICRTTQKLNLGQIRAWQQCPKKVPGTILFCHLGFNGTGTQADWSGQKNNGTVTGATVGPHVPLGPLFGFDLPVSWTAAAAAFTLDAQPGSFALTGQGVNPGIAAPAAAATFVLTGQGVNPGIAAPAAAGAFVLTGAPAGVVAAFVTNAAPGSYALAGQAATFHVAMPAGAGAYSWTGVAADLVFSGGAAQFELDATPGAFSLTGALANGALALKADPGSFLVAVGLAASGSDDFNRADGPVGAAWSTWPGFGALAIASNQARGNSAGGNAAIHASELPSNQWARAVVKTISGGTDYLQGLIVRASTAQASGYSYRARTPNLCELHRWDNGVGMQISSGGDTWVPGDVMELRAVGSKISVYRNGALVREVTDATYASGKAGLYFFGVNGRMDDWEAGWISAQFAIDEPAALGSYALSSFAATLAPDLFIQAAPGSYVLAGQAAGIALAFPAAPAVYSCTGFPAGTALALSASPGAIAWTGFDAGLVLAGAPEIGMAFADVVVVPAVLFTSTTVAPAVKLTKTEIVPNVVIEEVETGDDN